MFVFILQGCHGMSYHNCCIALWRLFVLLHVLSIKCVFYAKGYHHVFLEPELWNFCFVPLVRLGQETFCPATFCPRTYIVPGQYVAGTICRPMNTHDCLQKRLQARHIVPGQYMSWDKMSRDKMSPDRLFVVLGVENLNLKKCSHRS